MTNDPRCFFRLGILAFALCITGNLLDFPSETEAIIRAGVGGFGGMRSHGSYHSNYGGRVVWQSFGRGGSRRNKYQEPADKNRAYYEKKMAEWREKNKDVLAALEEKKKLAGDEFGYTDSSEASSSDEFDYDYEDTTSTTTSTTEAPLPTTEEIQTTTNEKMLLESTTIGATGNTTGLLETLSTTEDTDAETTTTMSTTTTTTTTTPRRLKKHFGLRYGRVRVERLQ